MDNLHLGPRAAYTPDIISFVTAKYGLGPIKRIQDLGGSYNLNLLLETHLKSLVLRVYRPWTTRNRLIALQNIKKKLYVGHFPVVLPLTALSGQTILEYHNRLVEVEEYVSHEQIKSDWETYKKSVCHDGLISHFFRRRCGYYFVCTSSG